MDDLGRNPPASAGAVRGGERGVVFRDRGSPVPERAAIGFQSAGPRPERRILARTLHIQGAVRNRSHLNLSEMCEMNARAWTPAWTGEALNQPTLGSVWGNDEGQDLAEYAILIGLIALVVIGAVTLLGGAIMTSLYQVIIDGLPFN